MSALKRASLLLGPWFLAACGPAPETPAADRLFFGGLIVAVDKEGETVWRRTP